MGRANKNPARQNGDFLKARQAITTLLPAIRHVARTPERFTAEMRAQILDLLTLGALSPDLHLTVRAISTLIALEAENQRRDHVEFRNWVAGRGPKPSFLVDPILDYDAGSGTASTGCKPSRQAA